ncbi:MAG: DUF1684 domain-containing protein [Melioribacter sp.]|nr:DUF1684 domain-containing protein [Melioribacter sp.]
MNKILHFFILFTILSCGDNLKEKGSHNYINEIKSWHKRRIENLKKENGWLNLIGLYWLKEGENKFGSDKSNDIIFPSNTPAFIGKFYLKDSTVKVKINEGVNVLIDGKKIKSAEMKNDLQNNPTILAYGSFRWNLIKRGKKYGIRLRDLESELVKNFKGIETFPINEDWKLEAKFEPYKPYKKIFIPNVLGSVEEKYSPGALIFNKDGKTFKVDVLDEGDSYFIIFADETNGIETYGAGRFLYVEKPKVNNKIYIDFNKAYNPPCAFTKFATCPLPPPQNFLKLRITAGEKNYSAH